YCVSVVLFGFIVTDVAAPSTVSLHDALPIFHAPRDGDVEPVVVDQCGDLVDDTVRGSAQFGVSVPDIDPGFGGRPCLAHDTEGPVQELLRGDHGHVGPVHVVLGRTGEQHGQANRVDTVGIDLLTQVHPVAQRLGHRPSPVDDLALAGQSAEGFGEVQHAHVVQNLGEEPGVQQVQGGVLLTADVVVDRSPLVHLLDVEGGGVQVRRAVAPGVPGRVHEGVHGVGVTFGRATAGRTVDLHPVLGRGQGGHTLGCQFGTLHLGQGDRQLVVGDRD